MNFVSQICFCPVFFEVNVLIDEPEKYRDAPISLQLVGRRYDDEKIIQALEFIQKNVKLPLAK
jgi:amidase